MKKNILLLVFAAFGFFAQAEQIGEREFAPEEIAVHGETHIIGFPNIDYTFAYFRSENMVIIAGVPRDNGTGVLVPEYWEILDIATADRLRNELVSQCYEAWEEEWRRLPRED
ncbi:MAG: hypothetical protein LBF08_07420 [Dysgonamonadaceae bacterium]|nr:hypothetical protein [Dysgonamonadaceae bacterium]